MTSFGDAEWSRGLPALRPGGEFVDIELAYTT
jgi:hypothetical protein